MNLHNCYIYFLLLMAPTFVLFATPQKLETYFSEATENTSKSQDKSITRCLLISRNVFSRNIPDSDFDKFLSNTQSILLDFYKLYKSDFERVFNSKSRHLMALKVLTEKLNLSINSCGEDQYPSEEDKLDINFAVLSYDLELNKSNTDSKMELIHSREEYVLKFLSAKSPDLSAVFLSLVKPIGISLFLASCALLLILTLVLWSFYKISTPKNINSNALSVSMVASVLAQALIGQCISYERTVETFPSSRIRFLYLTWLYYTILITSGYNGNLLQQLMEPAATLNLESFEDLLSSPKELVGFAESRLGQVPDILKCLGREAEEKPIFGRLLQKFHSRSGVSYPEKVVEGSVNMLAEEVTLRALLDTVERRYGISHYAFGKARISNQLFWAVSGNKPFSKDILQTFKLLGSSGIADYHRWQQEMAENLMAQKVLQAFFAGLFSTDVDEEDKDEDIVVVKAKLHRQLQSRIKSLGLAFSGGAEPIKLRHYLVMWILLGIGYITAWLAFIGETLILKKGGRIRFLPLSNNKTLVTSFEMPI